MSLLTSRLRSVDVLAAIRKHPDLTQKQLLGVVGHKSSNMLGKILVKLAAAGLITRKPLRAVEAKGETK